MDDFITSLDVIYICIEGFIVQLANTIDNSSNVENIEVSLRVLNLIEQYTQSSVLNETSYKLGIKDIVGSTGSNSVVGNLNAIVKTLEFINQVSDSVISINSVDERVGTVSFTINANSNLNLEQLNLLIKGIKTVICRVAARENEVKVLVRDSLVRVTVKE